MAVTYRAEVGRGSQPSNASATTQSAGCTVTATGMMIAMAGFRDQVGATDANVAQILWNTSGTATFSFTHLTSTTDDSVGSRRRIELWSLDVTATRIADVVAHFSEAVQSLALSVHFYTGVFGIGALGTATNSAGSDSPKITIQPLRGDSIGIAGIIRAATGNLTPNPGITERTDANTGNGGNDFNFYFCDAAATAPITLGASATTATARWAIVGLELQPTATTTIPIFAYDHRRRRTA